MRRELATLAAVFAIVASCKPEKPYDASFTFTANPLPPVPGRDVQYSFDATYVGLVEIYQGDELVGTVVNPVDEADAIHVFPAKSALVPRAKAYGVNGKIIEVEATRGSSPPGDAGGASDVVAPPPGPPPESCPGAADVTPDLDAGTACGTFGGTLVPVKIRNDRATQLWIYRDQWGAPPTPCQFQPAGVVEPGQTLDLPTIDNGVLRFVESTTAQPFRHVRVTQTPSCLLVAK